MAMSIEYDDKGTFYYFILSFFAIFLIPVTYYLFPNNAKKEDDSKKKNQCYCPPCQMKHATLTQKEPRKKNNEAFNTCYHNHFMVTVNCWSSKSFPVRERI